VRDPLSMIIPVHLNTFSRKQATLSSSGFAPPVRLLPASLLPFLRAPSKEKPAKGTTSHTEDEDIVRYPERQGPVLCSQCRTMITSTTEIMSIQGSHGHTFANPEGILFQIGCFRSAPGCGHIGEATEEWSWFKGFRWRVALCRGCLTHLGWLYASGSGDQFHGLILNRLVFPDDED
jgi:hypothetical protein